MEYCSFTKGKGLVDLKWDMRGIGDDDERYRRCLESRYVVDDEFGEAKRVLSEVRMVELGKAGARPGDVGEAMTEGQMLFGERGRRGSAVEVQVYGEGVVREVDAKRFTSGEGEGTATGKVNCLHPVFTPCWSRTRVARPSPGLCAHWSHGDSWNVIGWLHLQLPPHYHSVR